MFGKIKEGRSTFAASFGPWATSNQTQKPSGAARQVKAERFTGDGKLETAGIYDESLRNDLQGVLKRMVAIYNGGNPSPADDKSFLEQLGWVGKQALATIGLSMGPVSTEGDAVKHQRASVTTSGSGGGNTSSLEDMPLAAPLLNVLASRAAQEQAKAAQDISARISATGTAQPELVAVAGDLKLLGDRVVSAAGRKAQDLRTDTLRSLTGDIVGGAPSPIQQRIRGAAEVLFTRLDGPNPMPGAQSSQVLAETALHLFGKPDAAHDSGAELADALEALRDISPADLARRAVQTLASSGFSNGIPVDGTVHLAGALTSLTGGGGLIAKLMAREGIQPAQQEALRVAMLAVNGMQQELHESGGKISGQQVEWLANAARQAVTLISPGADGASDTPVSAQQAREQRVAFRGVQNDFMTNEPGSRYDEANQKLGHFAVGEIEQTAKRNVRAASGRLGRLANWATAGQAKVSKGHGGGIKGVARKVASKLPGSEQTVWRKSVLKGMIQSASANGMLPTRHEGLNTLDRTARDVRAALQAQQQREPGSPALPNTPQQQQADLGKLMLATLDHLNLGTADGARADEAACKSLGRSFFDKIAALHPEGMEHLGSQFAGEWDKLRGNHPNAGQVLKLVLDHMDMRALLDGAPPAGGNLMVSPSLTERGERTDRLTNEAIQAFSSLAGTVKAAARGAPDSPQVQALASLAETLASTLGAVKPTAALGGMRIDTFEAVENKLAKQLRASFPEGEAPDWQTAKQNVVAAWPHELQLAWAALKEAGPNVGRVLRTVTDAVARHMPDLPVDPSAPSTSQAPVTLRAALEEATGPLQALQRDVHANRFERAVADTVSLFYDVRAPRDASAVMESITQRISLGERIKNSDARRAGPDIGKMITTPISTSPVVFSPILGGGVARESSMDVNMSGSTLQIWIGDTKSKGIGGGLTMGFRGELGENDHQFNVDDDNAGLALRFDVRAETGYESALTDGLTVRVARVSGHEDVQRRELGTAMMELVNREGMRKPTGDTYPDELAAMLDLHPKLVVSNMANLKTTRAGETSAGAVLVARTKGRRDASEQARLEANHMTRFGGSLTATAKTQRQSSAQTESNGQLRVEEFKLSANQRTEVKAGAYAQIGLLPVDTQRGDGGQIDRSRNIAWAPLLRGGAIEYGKQLTNDAVDTTLRIVTDKGKTWPDQSQMIREHESLDSFLADVQTRHYQFATAMTGKDDVDGASASEKIGRGWERMREAIEQAAEAAGPNMSFIMVTKMRPEVALARDNLEGLAQLAERSGDQGKADNLRTQIDVLLSNHDSWTAGNMQFKTKAKKDKSQTTTLNIFQAKGAAETTRLHEFLPLGAQNVGRSPDMPSAAPLDHSGRWTLPDKFLGEHEPLDLSTIPPDLRFGAIRSPDPMRNASLHSSPLTLNEHSGQPEVPVQGRDGGNPDLKLDVPKHSSSGQPSSPIRSEYSVFEPGSPKIVLQGGGSGNPDLKLDVSQHSSSSSASEHSDSELKSPKIPLQRSDSSASLDSEVFFDASESFRDPLPADWLKHSDPESASKA